MLPAAIVFLFVKKALIIWVQDPHMELPMLGAMN